MRHHSMPKVFFIAGATALASMRSVSPTSAQEPDRSSASPACALTFDSLVAKLTYDYPGYADKVPGHPDMAIVAARARSEAVAAGSDWRPCVAALQRWVRAMADPHMQVWYSGPPASAGTVASPGTVAARPAADTANRPRLRLLDDSTALLRLPDFGAGYGPAIDSLVSANRARLVRLPYLVVDVRGNPGGCACAYSSVLPLMSTGPIRREGSDILSSADNIQLIRAWAGGDLPEDTKAELRSVLPRMEANPGKLVTFAPDEVLRPDTTYALPRAVGILVDRGCASSCEGFVLDARQSRKVLVFGKQHTGGFLDYGNAHNVALPGWYVLHVPATRSHHVAERHLDNIGIAPDVRLPDHAPAVAFVRAYLREHAAGQ